MTRRDIVDELEAEYLTLKALQKEVEKINKYKFQEIAIALSDMKEQAGKIASLTNFPICFQLYHKINNLKDIVENEVSPNQIPPTWMLDAVVKRQMELDA